MLIARAEQIGQPDINEVLRPASAGVLNAVFAFRDSHITMRQLKTSDRPVLVIIGDDDYASTGPVGWPDATKLMRWARFVILHGAGGEPGHYSAAVMAAQVHHRALMIETDTAHLDAWRALVMRIRPNGAGLIVRTRPGAPPHPMMHAPDGVVMQ